MSTTPTPPRSLRSKVLRPLRPQQPDPRPAPPAAPVVGTTITRRIFNPDTGEITLYEFDSVRGERTTILSAQDAALGQLPDNPTPLADQVALERNARGIR